MKEIELKPCPFCGGKAETHNCGTFENEKLAVIFDGRVGVHCSVCYVATTPYASEEEAIENWNKRTSQDEARKQAIDLLIACACCTIGGLPCDICPNRDDGCKWKDEDVIKAVKIIRGDWENVSL